MQIGWKIALWTKLLTSKPGDPQDLLGENQLLEVVLCLHMSILAQLPQLNLRMWEWFKTENVRVV